MPQPAHDVSRSAVELQSNGSQRRSNRSRIVVVTTALRYQAEILCVTESLCICVVLEKGLSQHVDNGEHVGLVCGRRQLHADDHCATYDRDIPWSVRSIHGVQKM